MRPDGRIAKGKLTHTTDFALPFGPNPACLKSMDRLAQTFARCKAESRPAFVSYVCAGDPDVATSKAILLSLAQNGADILEVGVPFSDPLADGLTNQLASQRALEGGMTYDGLLDILRAVRAGTGLAGCSWPVTA